MKMADEYILQNSRARVTIREVPYPAPNDGTYSQILDLADYANNELSKTFSVHIELHTRALTVALIGSHLSAVDRCALLDGPFLIVMMNEQLFKISLSDGTLVSYQVLDSFGSNFGIFRTEHGYVVHGEVEVLFLNEELEVTASFSGRDIFVSASGKEPFTLTKDTVQLYDFEDHYYELDLEGSLLNERAATEHSTQNGGHRV